MRHICFDPSLLLFATIATGLLLPASVAWGVDAECSGAIPLEAGIPHHGDTGGGPQNVYAYACWPRDAGGPEIVHSITTHHIEADITATLADLGENDLDVVVLADQGCESDACVAGDDQATLGAAPPGTHHIIVDGYEGAAGPYTLTVTPSYLCEGALCDDGNLCTVASCDPEAGCQFTPVDCDDGNPCTAGSCDPESGDCLFTPICSAPTITSVPPFETRAGELYRYDLDAQDDDGHSLAYFLESGPPGMTVDPASGHVEWLPGGADVGDHAVSLIAEDATGEIARQAYTLSVLEPRLQPADFSPTADVIGFDELAAGVPITVQLNRRGVALRAADGGPVVVVDAGAISPDDVPVTLPNAARSLAPDVPLEIGLLWPRSRVGVHVLLGAIPGEHGLRLRAFDASDELLVETQLDVPDAALRAEGPVFVGVTTPAPEISRVSLDFIGVAGAKVIDELMLDPPQDELVSVEVQADVLAAPDATREAKLEAIDALQLSPSGRASEILHDVAANDPDLYVRERAIMALAQVRDPASIAVLSEIGQTAPDPAIRLAAHNSVWALRRLFPIPAPPVVTLEVTSEVGPGLEIDAVATIVSPVDRDFVQIRFATGKWLVQLQTAEMAVYKGPLTAGEPVVLHGRFLSQQEGKTALRVFTRVNLNRVDATTFSEALYLDVRPSGSEVSAFPFMDQVDEHVLPIED